MTGRPHKPASVPRPELAEPEGAERRDPRAPPLPVAYVFARRDPKTGRRLAVPHLAVAVLAMPDTEQMAAALRDRLAAWDAAGYVLVLDVWALNDEDVEGGVDAWSAAGRRVREHPRARDVVTVMLEHRGLATTRQWSADVAADGAVGPFDEGTAGSGRLVGLLPRAGGAPGDG